jgi:hypothetical protein
MRFFLFTVLIFMYGCGKNVITDHKDIVYLFCEDKTFSLTEDYELIRLHHTAFAVVPQLNLIDRVEFLEPNVEGNIVGSLKLFFPWRTTSDISIEKNGQVIINGFSTMNTRSYGETDEFYWKTDFASYELDRASLELSRTLNIEDAYINEAFNCNMFQKQDEFEKYVSGMLSSMYVYAFQAKQNSQENLQSKRKL